MVSRDTGQLQFECNGRVFVGEAEGQREGKRVVEHGDALARKRNDCEMKN